METTHSKKTGRHENNVFTNSFILFPLATVGSQSLANTMQIHRKVHKHGAETQGYYTQARTPGKKE